MSVQFAAIDETGGQAIVREDGRWFRISLDTAWQPVPLKDEFDAARCSMTASYVGSYLRVTSLQEASRVLRTICTPLLQNADDLPFESVSRFCPPEILARYGLLPAQREVSRVWAALSVAMPDTSWESTRRSLRAAVSEVVSEERDEVLDYVLLYLTAVNTTRDRELTPQEQTDRLRNVVTGVLNQIRRTGPFGLSVYVPLEIPDEPRARAAGRKLFEALSPISRPDWYLLLVVLSGTSLEEVAERLGASVSRMRRNWEDIIRGIRQRLLADQGS